MATASSDKLTRRWRQSAAKGTPSNSTEGAATGGAASDTGVQPHLRAFTQTAEVPLVGGTGAALMHFAETGSIPVTARSLRRSRRSPIWFRVWAPVTTLLLAAGVAGLVIHHYEPRWLDKIHVTRASWTGTASSGHPPVRGANPTHTSTPASRSVVTPIASVPGSTSASVSVSAKGYQVVVAAQQACWIDATVPFSSVPVFEGVLQPGETKVLTPAWGALSVQFGAGGVLVAVQVKGKLAPGWLFRPPTVPFTLTFAPAPGY